MSQHEDKREIYQQGLEMELLTERRLAKGEWHRQATEAARAYARRMPSDPDAFDVIMTRMHYEITSIAEVRRASKEGWAL